MGIVLNLTGLFMTLNTLVVGPLLLKGLICFFFLLNFNGSTRINGGICPGSKKLFKGCFCSMKRVLSLVKKVVIPKCFYWESVVMNGEIPD